MIKVGIVGPESTGKTSLAKALAAEYGVPCVPEYAREYLSELDRPYEQSDLLEIARGQLDSEWRLAKQANGLMILDTDLHVIQVWSEYKYGEVNPWILQQLHLHHCDTYLITYHDIPYEEDPLRENPNERPELFDIYEKLIREKNFSYRVIEGSHEKRLATATNHINSLL